MILTVVKECLDYQILTCVQNVPFVFVFSGTRRAKAFHIFRTRTCARVRPNSRKQCRVASHTMRAFEGLPPRGNVLKEILPCTGNTAAHPQATAVDSCSRRSVTSCPFMLEAISRLLSLRSKNYGHPTQSFEGAVDNADWVLKKCLDLRLL